VADALTNTIRQLHGEYLCISRQFVITNYYPLRHVSCNKIHFAAAFLTSESADSKNTRKIIDNFCLADENVL